MRTAFATPRLRSALLTLLVGLWSMPALAQPEGEPDAPPVEAGTPAMPSSTAQQAACPPGNMLLGLKPVQQSGLTRPERLTNGEIPGEGDEWDTEHTTLLNGASAFAVFDLGRPIQLAALLLQGDNNDTYEISVSQDGRTFTPLWTAPMHPFIGMRTRLTQGLNTTARYVRLGKAYGDDAFSVGELGAWCVQPELWPPALNAVSGAKGSGKTDDRKVGMSYRKMVVGGLSALALIGLFVAGRFGRRFRGLLAITPVAAAAALFFAVTRTRAEEIKGPLTLFPVKFETYEFWAIGVALGLLLAWGAWVLVALVRHRGFERPLERGAMIAVMLACGYSWSNYGTFHGSKIVHYWDSFHYYVGSKYFHENNYHLIYKCSAVGELDDGRSDEVMKRKMRDLTDNRLLPATELLADQSDCRAAFTPERWAAFKQDLRLFRSYMGTAWWQKMFKDHGYNASPVWTMVGQTISNYGWDARVPPEELVNSPKNLLGKTPEQRRAITKRFKDDQDAFQLRIGRLALIDGLLYLGIFLAIVWAFGLRIGALAAVVWGTGYPWAYFWTGGSFGRVPWLFMATLGICLMKRGFYFLGGFGVTWSALLRVFPGALAGGVTLKILGNLIFKRTLVSTHKRIILGAIAAVVILVGASLPITGGPTAYKGFIENSLKHRDTPLTNNMGIPTMFAFHPKFTAKKTKNEKLEDPFLDWKKIRKGVQSGRQVFYLASLLALFGLVFYLGKRLEDWEATAISVVFIMGIFELTCYYYSFVLLMAPTAMRKFRYMLAILIMTPLGMFIQLKIGWYDVQYTVETLIVLVTFLYILGDMAVCQYLEERAAKALPPPADGAASPPAELPA